MGILMWDKPKKKMSAGDWKESYGFEDGPTGGYQPNMSEDDARRWKAKITGTKLGFPQVEIRKKAGASLMTIIVNLGAGYNYKHACSGHKDDGQTDAHRLATQTTSGINIHLSMNGPSLMTFSDMEAMNLAIAEAKAALEALESAPGERRLYYVEGNPSVDDLVQVPGVRVHQEIARYRVISAPLTALSAIEATSGVTALKTGHQVRWEAYKALGYDRFTREEDLE